MNFVNLHNHSHFSILDGLGKPEEYVLRVAELDQPAVSLTDHGSLSGIFQLWKSCQGTGIKPIAGCEFYIAPESRHTKEPVLWGTPEQKPMDVSKGGAFGHITILAENAAGVRSLFRLQEAAYREGFYHKPRIDLDLLAEHNDGLLCLTGCASSLLATRLRLDQPEEARDHLSALRDIFGDRIWVELMYHGIATEDLNEFKLNHQLMEVADELAFPVVATADAHYCNRDDDSVHSALLCIQTGSKLDSPKFAFNGSGFHLASADEMERLFAAADLPKCAIPEAAAVAERIGSYDEIFRYQLRMPKFSDDPCYQLDYEVNRWLAKHDYHDTLYETRAQYEIDTISSLGFADYFLVLADVLAEAKGRGIRIGPARGSAGGSLVAHALGITDLDPIPTGLLFERFLNPERVGLPDIDVDIQEDRRDEVIEIARQKYGGDDYVAPVATYQNIKARAALKDAARVLGHSYKIGEEAVKQFPYIKGRAPTLADYTGDRSSDIYSLAVGLEGTVRAESIHPAAIVVSPVPLVEIVPLRRPGSGQGHAVVALDMYEVEQLGLVKQDYLGLRTLKVIDDCLRLIQGRHGSVPDLPTDPADCTDTATFALLGAGNTLGVFQLDSAGMRDLLRAVAPESLSDIAAVLALYRPGPMGFGGERSYAARKAGREGIQYPHHDLEAALEPILRDTYGLIVYQEQVLEALAAVADYTYATAELIFNAMRKKQLDKMNAAKPDFEERMRRNGYCEEAISALWETLVPFAGYSFNKSHSYGYGLLAYWTAFLKANYPREFMAALLSNEPNNSEKAKQVFRSYLDECARMGIEILPPDINECGDSFTPTDDGIRYGLASIKGIGDKAIGPTIKKRPYKTLTDFYRRAPLTVLNAGVLGAMVRSGALDSLAGREAHLERYEDLTQRARTERAARQKGQRGIVQARYTVPAKTADMKRRRQWERETLGVELSTGSVVVAPAVPMNRPALEWLKATIESCPGRQRVFLDFGQGKHVDTGCNVDGGRLREALGAIQATVNEDFHPSPR